tara:strand:+ start:391 stop:615 length:225 start_codon:yes stop_codon:yes gene_type:complete
LLAIVLLAYGSSLRRRISSIKTGKARNILFMNYVQRIHHDFLHHNGLGTYHLKEEEVLHQNGRRMKTVNFMNCS